MANPLGPAHPNLQRSPEPESRHGPQGRGDGGAGARGGAAAALPGPKARATGGARAPKPASGPSHTDADTHVQAPSTEAHGHRQARTSAAPNPRNLGLALPDAGVGLAQPRLAALRPLPGLPGPAADADRLADDVALSRRRSGPARTPFERLFGGLEATGPGGSASQFSPLALPIWRLPHVAATLTLPLPTPRGQGNAVLRVRVRLQRPQVDPGPVGVAVAVAVAPRPRGVSASRPKSGPENTPVADAAGPPWGAQTGAAALVPGPLAPLPTAATSPDARAPRPLTAAAGLWTGLDAPKKAAPSVGPSAKALADHKRSQAKARSALRFKAFALAGAYAARKGSSVAQDEEDEARAAPLPAPKRQL